MSKFRTALLAGAMVVGLGAAAEAAIKLRASVSSNGGPFNLLGLADDSLTPGFAFGSFSGFGITVVIQSAIGHPADPFPNFSTTFNATNSNQLGQRILLLEFTQTDVPANPFNALMSDFAITSLLSGSGATIASFIDDTNTAFGTATPLFSNVFTASGQADSTDSFSATGTYSQTITVKIAFPGATSGTVAGSAQLAAPIPEPASLALFGMGLLGLGFAVRRRAA